MALNKLHSTNVQLLDDLACIREDFFQAVAKGPETTNEFACRFTQLADQATAERIQDIIQVDGKSRLAAAHNAVTTIGFVATGLYEVMKCADDLTAQLHLDIDDLLENLSLCNDTSSRGPTVCPTASPSNSASSSTLHPRPRRQRLSSGSSTSLETNDIGLPRYQLVSHRWLCDNLHNPYPSASTKRKIAESSEVTSKVIGEWFSQARRRIGWTALLKKRFGGNRQLCIDCAHDIFNEGSSCSFYSPEITQDFRRMKSKTERLYRDRFGRSDVVKEITDIEPAASVHSGLGTGIKRRSSAIEDYHPESHELSEYEACSIVRPAKRMRCVCIGNLSFLDLLTMIFRESFQSDLPPLSRTTSFSTSVSSRSSTAELLTPTIQPFALPGSDFDDAIGEWVSSVSAEAAEDHVHESLPSRKRSMSESDSHGSGKRLKLNEPDTPWPRSLSESLLNSRYVEQELHDQFDFQLPPAASVVSELGDGGPLQIDLFSYANWDASQIDHPCRLCKSDFSSRLFAE